MSWSIGETVNTVHISKKCAEELFGAQNEDEIWYSPKDVAPNGTVTFNSDHQEHMDWLSSGDKLVAILKKHKVKGDICFGSLEGDNDGQFWGYRFDGKGGMKFLAGRVVYEEERTPLANMTFVFTGTLSGITRTEARERVCGLGAKVSDSISRKVTHLIVGAKPGSKVAKAYMRELGIKILNEKQFLELLK